MPWLHTWCTMELRDTWETTGPLRAKCIWRPWSSSLERHSQAQPSLGNAATVAAEPIPLSRLNTSSSPWWWCLENFSAITIFSHIWGGGRGGSKAKKKNKEGIYTSLAEIRLLLAYCLGKPQSEAAWPTKPSRTETSPFNWVDTGCFHSSQSKKHRVKSWLCHTVEAESGCQEDSPC